MTSYFSWLMLKYDKIKLIQIWTHLGDFRICPKCDKFLPTLLLFCPKFLVLCKISQIIKQPKVHSPCMFDNGLFSKCVKYFFPQNTFFKICWGEKINICLQIILLYLTMFNLIPVHINV